MVLPSREEEEETVHRVETASSTSETTTGGCWTSSPISGRMATGRGRSKCGGPNPQALLLADLLPKSKDQMAALTSATTTPGMRGGEAPICCLNTDRESVGSSSQRTTNGGQVLVGPWMYGKAYPTTNAKQQPQSALESLPRKVLVQRFPLILEIISRRLCAGAKLSQGSFTYTSL